MGSVTLRQELHCCGEFLLLFLPLTLAALPFPLLGSSLLSGDVEVTMPGPNFLFNCLPFFLALPSQRTSFALDYFFDVRQPITWSAVITGINLTVVCIIFLAYFSLHQFIIKSIHLINHLRLKLFGVETNESEWGWQL